MGFAVVLATMWLATQWTAWRLGYQPQDDSEPYAEAVLAAEPAGADPIAEHYQGGTFCAAEYAAKTRRD